MRFAFLFQYDLLVIEHEQNKQHKEQKQKRKKNNIKRDVDTIQDTIAYIKDIP